MQCEVWPCNQRSCEHHGTGPGFGCIYGDFKFEEKAKKKYIEVEWANSEAIFVFKFWVNQKL
jgi:hypothetical protein